MDRRNHVKLDKALLGYTNESLHEWLDLTVKYLGSSHRQVKHGHKAIKWAGELFGEKGGKIAALHILVDTRVLDRDWLEDYITKK